MGNALGLEVSANFVVNLTRYGYDEMRSIL